MSGGAEVQRSGGAESQRSTPAPLLPGSSAPPPEMTPLEYEVWREFIRQRCGLYITENRLRFLRQRLWERMTRHGVRSYSEYYHYVAYNTQGDEEWNELLELLLNQETGFFRHLPSYNALTGHVLPELLREKRKRGVSQVAFWSAGCSTGQEAYSLAMAFLETVAPTPPPLPLPSPKVGGGERAGGRGEGWQLKVTGTDISLRALHKARRGQYKAYEVRLLPNRYRDRYLTAVAGEREATYQIVEPVRALTQFGPANLADPRTGWVSAQDVIFCQNVLIYFSPESRGELVWRLCQRLNPGGYLFLAPAEAVGLQLPGVQPVRLPDSLIYRREA